MFPIRLAKVNVDYAADVAMDYDAFCSEIRSSCCTFEGVKTDDELDCFIDKFYENRNEEYFLEPFKKSLVNNRSDKVTGNFISNRRA
uniref:Uncharacterized protein n=1 Tax=Wuchereria bancrofti TaxID=6293 RepID=A0A1I8EX98_WUCBA